MSEQQPLYLPPEAYDAKANSKGRRTNLANYIAETARGHVFPTRDSGAKSPFLDIAAGTGIISHALAAKGYAVTSFDQSEPYLNYLQTQYPQDKIKTKTGDMNRSFQLQTGTFAGVTTVWANRFIEDHSSLIKRVHNVLESDGVFVWPVFSAERTAYWAETGNKMPSVNELKEGLQERFGTVYEERVGFVSAVTKGIEVFGRPRILVAKKI